MKTKRPGLLLASCAFSFFCASNVYAGIVYVSATNGSDSNDGSSWELAKQTIQAGVDVSISNDTVLVTNGTYNTGGRIPPGQVLCRARVVIDKSVSVISVNGPSNTFIVGQGPRGETAIRCVWMTNNTYLTGFTLTNGYTVIGVGGSDENGGGVFAKTNRSTVSNCIFTSCQAFDGGGAYNGIINNCIFTGNMASNGGGGTALSTLNNCTLIGNSANPGGGGGAYISTLNNCTLTGNSGNNVGGGAYGGTLNNCTLTSNSAAQYMGGGAYFSTLNNCMLTDNLSSSGGGGAALGTLNNCLLIRNSAGVGGGGVNDATLNNCTVYGNTNGGIDDCTVRNTISFGNAGYEIRNSSTAFCYTNNPMFVDAAADDLHLQSNSPCINAGWNAFAPTNVTPYDLGDNPRIAQLTVDMGAYEFQGQEYFDILVSAGMNGSIIPSGVIRTNHGADVSFVIQPDAYFYVQNILTNGSSAGTSTNFTWHSISAPGTVTVSFAATLAAHGTPHWWLAQFGWTNNFDAVESLDQDGDSLFTWEEYPHNTCPTNANTDGDQYNDGVEINAGADPLQDDSRAYGAIQTHPASFNLYTSNSVLDLSYGEMMVQMVSNNIQVRLTMQSTDMLDGDGWTNVGPAVEWECPADLNKSFFRFLGTPTD